MMHTNTSVRKQSRLAKGLGMLLVAALLFSSQAPAAEAFWRYKRHWSKVQAVTPETRTAVLLHKDLAPRGKRKIKGWFHSATPESVTLMQGHGAPRTVEKEGVRRVLVFRPAGKRYQPPIAAEVGTALAAPLLLAFPPAFLFAVGSFVAPATGITFVVAPKMGGIYNVPRSDKTRQKVAAGSAPNRKDS